MKLSLFLNPLEQKWFRALAGTMIHAAMRFARMLIHGTDKRPAFRETESLAWVHALESNFEAIRLEMEPLIAARAEFFTPFAGGYGDEKREGDWRIFQFLWQGKFHPEAEARCPATTAALRQIPGLRTASFSFLGPNERIPLHAHPTIRQEIFHLGLRVPKDSGQCQIRVGESTRGWDEGKVILFDPSLPHEVWNLTEEIRVVLAGEVGKPLFSRPASPAPAGGDA